MKVQIYNEDCISGMSEHVPDGSWHLAVTSIPFEELFTYSGKLEDVGNNGSTVDVEAGRFMLNMRFVIEQLFRVTVTGCNVCIHVQQLLAYKNQHGYAGRRNFRDATVKAFQAGGFTFHGEWAIPKDPQAMAQRLSLHSLQFKTGHSRSATSWAGAPNDYVLVFQKPGEAAIPVRPLVYAVGKKPMRRDNFYTEHGLSGAVGVNAYTEYLQKWARENDAINPTGWLSADDWIKWASGVWHDIDEFDILDGARSAKESDEEKHVCPLQLEVIRRCILLYSNPASIQPDVTVGDPFNGIGSTPHEALILGRNAVGFELKESYFNNALKNVEWARVKLANAGKPDAQAMLPGFEKVA